MGEVIGMCGRYSLAPEENAEIEKLLREIQGRFKTGEIFPTNDVPVLMEAGAELVGEDLSPDYILPAPFDERVCPAVAAAVADAARRTGAVRPGR